MKKGIIMINYELPIYDEHRKWIRNARNKGVKWEKIFFANNSSEEKLVEFLNRQVCENFWEECDVFGWNKIVEQQKKAEEETKNIDFLNGQAMIRGEGEDNAVTIPHDPKSSWQLYRNKLEKEGFNKDTIDEIERTTLKLLKRLSNDTSYTHAVKGLVVGNVQSGKTANMAALLAMAADWGWNMFVVLSGTIDNLRQQTQTRLLNDLNHPGNLSWIGLEHLSKKVSLGQRAQDLHFTETSKQRYFTVCLKNKSRLEGLIDWLQQDANQQQKMKILVIDDESDQAGVNTADINSDTYKVIYRLIRDLVNGKSSKSEIVKTKYKAMNYIGYTATPYANVLNEAGEETLYPKNFISTLGVSRQYFGPQQIFGLEGDDGGFEGLDIIRRINDVQLLAIKDIHDEGLGYTPTALKNAIAWFLCGVACMRFWEYKKPISMLVHTSQKTNHHTNVANAISGWLKGTSQEELLLYCEKIWNEETDKLTLEKFREQYKSYEIPNDKINNYPTFSDIKKELSELLNVGLTNIPLNEEGELDYHNGIHMCIDNCKNNGVNDDGMYVRLAYPTKDNTPNVAPAFIIIGGATLSRGLTIEGLISTFFLRTVKQADTLMQMARWFGYRRGYELLPRIWLTHDTQRQFEFLAQLDQELRDEIQEMDTLGKSPSIYGTKIKNSPKLSFIRITSKNKMQSVKLTGADYSGSYSQTYLFENDEDILLNNLEAVRGFITELNEPDVLKECNKGHAKNAIVWRSVKFELIKQLLRDYKFHSRQSMLNNIDSLIDWVEKVTNEGKLEDWNIVLAGKENSNGADWDSPIGPISKVSRTRKISNIVDDNTINIGALRMPKDMIADVDLEGKSSDIIQLTDKFEAKNAKRIRAKVGMESTPQIIIYIIDKDSKALEKSITAGTRVDLQAKKDIAGLCINIPSGKCGVDYATTISIDLSNANYDTNDLEDTDED